MGIGSWWRKLRAKDDEAKVERVLEEQDETPEERRVSEARDFEALGADQQAAASMHEPTIEDADRLSD